MTRERRLSRDLPIDIDLSQLQHIAVTLQANHKQFRNAYARALKRTVATLRKRALSDMKKGLAPRSLQMVRKRLLAFRMSRGEGLDEAKIWFGLNSIKLKDLRGRVRGRVRPHHDVHDPSTGRFAVARRRATAAAGFDPQGSMLSPANYPGGEVGKTRDGRKTVLLRDPVTRRTREAEIDIYAPMLDYVEDHAFADAMEIFTHHFETDLRGRVKARINV